LVRPPGLAVVLVGEDPASQVYVRRKGQVAERLGFVHRQVDLPETVGQKQLNDVLDALAGDGTVDGILLQMPLPRHLSADEAIAHIPHDKDVDGFTTWNAGLLAQGRPSAVPCTPAGVMRLLADAEVDLRGTVACVVGRSNIVGRPMAQLLEQAHATVTVCHSRTRDLAAHTWMADVLVVAVGQPRRIGPTEVRPGAVVIDVGINRLADGSLAGDVDFDAVVGHAGAITPVPGGVGPMTIAMLMENTWRAACLHQGVPAPPSVPA
jgi:methylenetetrahydrofolate dehydrogenase (NADP+)/methenyltetrahydrofolate cyclohydrolase